jgi:hypothetical protein
VSALPMLMYPAVEDAFWSLRQRILIYDRLPALEFSVLLPILGFLLTLSALWITNSARNQIGITSRDELRTMRKERTTKSVRTGFRLDPYLLRL